MVKENKQMIDEEQMNISSDGSDNGHVIQRRLSSLSMDGSDLQRQTVSIKAMEAPMLSVYAQREIRKFFEEKKKYDKHCYQYGAIPMSIRDMIDVDVRESICYVDLKNKTTPSEVDSEDLNEVMKSYVNTSQNNGISREEAFTEIKMNLSIRDPTARVHDYNRRINTMLRTNGWSKLYRGKDSVVGMRKKLIQFLIGGIQPHVVQEAVRNQMDQLKATDSTNEGEFWHILKSHAIYQNIYHGGRSKPHIAKEQRGKRKERPEGRGRDDSGKRPKRVDDDKRHGGRKFTCFGCNGQHRLADCDKYDRKEKQAIIERKRAEWKVRKNEKDSQ